MAVRHLTLTEKIHKKCIKKYILCVPFSDIPHGQQNYSICPFILNNPFYVQSLDNFRLSLKILSVFSCCCLVNSLQPGLKDKMSVNKQPVLSFHQPCRSQSPWHVRCTPQALSCHCVTQFSALLLPLNPLTNDCVNKHKQSVQEDCVGPLRELETEVVSFLNYVISWSSRYY